MLILKGKQFKVVFFSTEIWITFIIVQKFGICKICKNVFEKDLCSPRVPLFYITIIQEILWNTITI